MARMRARIGSWWRGLSTRGKAIVAGVIVVLLLAIGVSGNPPDPTSPSPRPSVAIASSAPPSEKPATPAVTEEASPSGESVAQFGAQIPGLTAADVKLNLGDRGFTCEGQTLFLDGIDEICQDERDPTFDYRVEIVGMNPTDIRQVEAVHFWYGDKAVQDGDADAFLGYIATLPYEGAEPEAARAWVEDNDEGTATFGGATFTLTTGGDGLARILTISGQ